MYEDTDKAFYRLAFEIRKQELREQMEALEKAITHLESTFDKDQL
jgi:hypothetical protein